VLPPLNLSTIAAITPPDVSVKIIDDRIDEIHYDENVDLEGITCITETAGRADDIAGEFRKRAVKVILGGIHPALTTDDALEHADSVFCGELFGRWEVVVRDFQLRRLQRVYRNMQPADLSHIPPPRF
jgi:hypothetical protein